MTTKNDATDAGSTTAIAIGELEAYVTTLFERVGLRPDDARLLSASLVDADSHGMTTHGTARVASYAAQLSSGQVNPQPNERVLSDRPSGVLIDADGAFGAPVGIRALDLAMPKARATGVAIAGVTNVAHFGAAGFYTRYAAERGFLALAMSSSSASVVPFGGSTPRIGNSPMSFAAPGRDHPELNMDMAQSVAARGKIKLFKDRGEALPENWAVDADGYPTTDPDAALRGAVLPSGGHKGSAMSLVVEMLASGLTGAHLTQEITHAGFTSVAAASAAADVTVGNFYLVIDADVFGDAEAVRSRATTIADYVRDSPAAPGIERVLAPGDLELENDTAARAAGITLLPATARELVELGGRYGIDVPAALAAQAAAAPAS